MSARHQKDKRLRPRNEPYKRDHFNKSKFLGQVVKPKAPTRPVSTNDVANNSVVVVGDETVMSASVLSESVGYDDQTGVSLPDQQEDDMTDCQ